RRRQGASVFSILKMADSSKPRDCKKRICRAFSRSLAGGAPKRRCHSARIAERALDRLAAYALALELAADAPPAVASRLLRDQRMREAFVRQKTLRRKLVEHGDDFVARCPLANQAVL